MGPHLTDTKVATREHSEQDGQTEHGVAVCVGSSLRAGKQGMFLFPFGAARRDWLVNTNMVITRRGRQAVAKRQIWDPQPAWAEKHSQTDLPGSERAAQTFSCGELESGNCSMAKEEEEGDGCN